ncbi:MAG: asparagine synthase (glutamine-hydrolyzing) [Metallibacterium scheffleri]|jgi:asparagine synthase (glutamine-hydrolysing)|uniref:asparagine synthase (glutamine-hydrolyzing) n=1 Tax=Metallibacterium scheffleri TaxID=993689 RepID=UPI0026EA9BD0|nr:asparagine synthase (glutamine-hydrolyzing) [Metallibacterium scheffleri]MCK9367478.1 asparagine synthase (glutamine-hydrolyzing) [Metallibacterium scheffleri]
MCGLAGIHHRDGAPVDSAALLRMREHMQTRGPDGAGLWLDPRGGLGLAHRRLAILDLSETGAQPMATPDGRYCIVFNGEIYNHPELRAWCEARGARYSGHSDTETLLHLYALQGEAMLPQLRGMFAFALWDATGRTLLLARDPLGIKPLYYSEHGGTLAFASQVKALQAGGFGAGIDAAGLVSFLLFGYVLEPHTIDAAIRALPAGHAMLSEAGKAPRVWQYRDALAPLREPAAQPQAPDLLAALRDSVQHHLLSDVPVGLFLSAGMDSTAICALASAATPRSELRAVTLGFAEYTGLHDDEVPGASAVAQRCGVSHRVVRVRREDFAGDLEHILHAMDQPSVDGVNTWLVSRAAAGLGLKVALTGVGGDELFGSYPSYRQVPRMAAALRWLPGMLGVPARELLRRTLPRRLSPKYAGALEWGRDVPGAYFLRRALFMPWELAGLIGADVAREGLRTLALRDTLRGIVRGMHTPFDQVMALETSIYMRNCLLRDADWAGMAHSLEIRTPLADADLYADVIALRRSAHEPLTKADLKAALGSLACIDPHLLARRKTGFNVPVREWLLDPSGDDGAIRGMRGWAKMIMRQARTMSP